MVLGQGVVKMLRSSGGQSHRIEWVSPDSAIYSWQFRYEKVNRQLTGWIRMQTWKTNEKLLLRFLVDSSAQSIGIAIELNNNILYQSANRLGRLVQGPHRQPEDILISGIVVTNLIPLSAEFICLETFPNTFNMTHLFIWHGGLWQQLHPIRGSFEASTETAHRNWNISLQRTSETIGIWIQWKFVVEFVPN